MPAAQDPFDRASRFLLRQGGEVLPWLLGLPAAEFDFVQWLDTRRLGWPGQPERTGDTVAHLRQPAAGGLPWAVAVEFQSQPDPEMFGRALCYLGQLWLDLKPTPHPGDRFCVALVVVNLTGNGDGSRDYDWEQAGLRTTLLAREWNLGRLKATDILDGVAAGTVPRPVLAWTPLMRGGDDTETIQRWLALAGQEPDRGRRATLGLATVFADLAGCRVVWKDALKEWNMLESQTVKEWQRQAEMEGKATTLLRVLKRKFGDVPEAVAATVRATTDIEQLDRWTETAALVGTLDEFRRDGGL